MSADENLSQEKLQVHTEEVAQRKGAQIQTRIIRERTAGILAIMMAVLFTILIFIPIFKPSLSDYIKDILLCVNALLGAAFGFYFSEKRLG